MKERTETAWFIVYRAVRSEWTDPSSGRRTRKACVQAALNNWTEGLEEAERVKRYDEFHASLRAGHMRPAKFSITWAATR